MRKTIEILKVAFLYVGAMVGAGFAGGKEIKLYFGEANVFTLILSSLFLGGFCALFLAVGSVGRVNVKMEKVLNATFALGSVVCAGVMLAALTELTETGFSALAVCVVCAVALFFKEGAKKFCFFAVPFIIVTLALVYFACDGRVSGEFLPLNALAYATMNLFFEFALMKEQGKYLKIKECFLVGVVVAVVSFVLLYAMRYCVAYNDSSLPFTEVAASEGYGFFATVTVFLAVASTVVGCFSVSANSLPYIPKSAAVLCVCACALSIASYDFQILIKYVYPSISVLGFAVICFAVSSLTVGMIRTKHEKTRSVNYS